MKRIGIVVEYNPLHNGHKYQIYKVKEMYPDSVIIVAMSSHYTLRGEVSVLSKWDKTRIALECGVDIILEIPFVFSNQSADTFSYAAMFMLNEFKIDTLVFGSESNNKDFLISCAKIQINNKDFDIKVKEYIAKGESYPSSLASAIKDMTGNIVKDSNDILAISYIKEIINNKMDVNIVPIKRTNSFNDLELDDCIVSASNVRKRFSEGEDVSKYVPTNVKECLRKIDYEMFFKLLKYKVISEKKQLSKYHLILEGIDNRIYKESLCSSNLNEFINNIKTKRYTLNKVKRILMNIFVGFTKEDALRFKSLEYVRILGLSKRGQEYYKSIKSEFSLPVITKFEKFDMLELELKATILYSMLVNDEKLIQEEIKKHVILG